MNIYIRQCCFEKQQCTPFVKPNITVQEFGDGKSCIEQSSNGNSITDLLIDKKISDQYHWHIYSYQLTKKAI
jgi:hypothetical protein